MKLWKYRDGSEMLPDKWLSFSVLSHGKAIVLRLPSYPYDYSLNYDCMMWRQWVFMWSTWNGFELKPVNCA